MMVQQLNPNKTEDKSIDNTTVTDVKDATKSVTKKKTLLSELLTRKISIKIKKPLIPLKLSLFVWFGAGASIFPFIQVFLKQRGLTIAQISFIYMLNPCLQFLGPVISGIIADKIGRSKPVVLGNLFLALVVLSSMLLIPDINLSNCMKNTTLVACNPGLIVIEGACNTNTQQLCKSQCPNDQVYEECKQYNKSFFCEISNQTVPFNGIMISTFIYSTNKTNIYSTNETDIYSTNETDIYSMNETDILCHADAIFLNREDFNWCENSETKKCNLSCHLKPASENHDIFCSGTDDNGTLVFCMALIFLISFHTVASTIYRMLDFTVMSMVKAHDSDFGRERFWAITGSLLFSTFSGYAVDQTTKIGGPKNYNTAIYLFDIMTLITMLTIYKLDIQIQPPGKQMMKKSLSLLKNLDIAVFSIVLLILGTCWCFIRQFSPLFLDTLGAPSLLLGLGPSLNCLFGLPFTVTSNFWVDKIGSNNVLVLGFASHTALFVGYSYLVNPWWSLAYELTGILNYHILWVAVIRHSYNIAPEGLTATIVSTAGALHFAIGKGTGSMLGGLTMSKYGGRSAFKLMAIISGCSGLLYALYLFAGYLCSKKRLETSSNTKDEIEAVHMS